MQNLSFTLKTGVLDLDLSINFKDGTFVSSKDLLGYQEVIDDFKNSKTIRIITYNLSRSSKDDKLFERLLALESDIDVQIITNIPSRFPEYYKTSAGEYLRRTASTNIDTYLKKLNPNDFKAKIHPFFNFNNHAKIIGTENIVYIGSANFSNESAKNYEAGILIRDKEFIAKLYKSFFENLKKDSVPYFDDDFNKLRLFTVSILTRLINHYNYILDEIFIYSKRMDNFVFIHDETRFSVNDLFELMHDLYELEEIEALIENIDCENYNLKNAVNNLLELFEQMNIKYLQDLIEIDSPFYDYISYTFQNTFDNRFKEYCGVAYDENLEYYIEKASDEARDILTDLCTAAEKDINDIKLEMEKIIEIIKKIIIVINDNASNAININIDNT